MFTMNIERYLPALNKLEQHRKQILVFIITSRLLMFAALVLFFSLFFGFLKLFTAEASDGMFDYFKWFFYLIAGGIMTAFVYNAIQILFRLAGSKWSQNVKIQI